MNILKFLILNVPFENSCPQEPGPERSNDQTHFCSATEVIVKKYVISNLVALYRFISYYNTPFIMTL